MESNKTPAALAEQFGERLKQARLNINLTQQEVADRAGVSRKIVMGAEKGKVQLEALAAILVAMDLESHLEACLPRQEISPIQLAKLHGKKRQRASGTTLPTANNEASEW